MTGAGYAIAPAGPEQAPQAAALLDRFFREEGFDTPFNRIASSLDLILADTNSWVGLATVEGRSVGVVTVTTTLYIEWARLGEVADLYVLPEFRKMGIGRALIEAALAWCRARDCSAVSVVITPTSEERHGLSAYYAGLQFSDFGRTIMTRTL